MFNDLEIIKAPTYVIMTMANKHPVMVPYDISNLNTVQPHESTQQLTHYSAFIFRYRNTIFSFRSK